jgi:hypothetical protein
MISNNKPSPKLFQKNNPFLLRHSRWRRRSLCIARRSGEAVAATSAWWGPKPIVLRHWKWRSTRACVATLSGEALAVASKNQCPVVSLIHTQQSCLALLSATFCRSRSWLGRLHAAGHQAFVHEQHSSAFLHADSHAGIYICLCWTSAPASIVILFLVAH